MTVSRWRCLATRIAFGAPVTARLVVDSERNQ